MPAIPDDPAGRSGDELADTAEPRSHRPVAMFAMEQHLGHRTYYENLREHLDDSRCRAVWVPIDYSVDRSLDRIPLPPSVKAAISARTEVRRSAAEHDADVHVFNTQVPAVLGGRAARSRPYVVITDVTPLQYDRMADGYGHRPDRPGPRKWIKQALNRRMFEQAAWCVGWSEWVCRSLVDDYGVDPAATRAIPPGVDTSWWHPGPSRDDGVFRVLFVGGDLTRKGGDQLMRAFAKLPDHAELVLVTKSRVASRDRVRVVNDLEPNDPRLMELYRSADVFALPSLAETFGIAAAEAAASGLPVVASDVGGLPDIVDHGVTGFTLPVGDEQALAAALESLVDHDVRRRMGAAARARATDRLDASTNAARLVDLIVDAAQH